MSPYSPLPSTSHYIRELRFLPTTKAVEIRCELSIRPCGTFNPPINQSGSKQPETSLHDIIAISYCWGGRSDETKLIWVNNEEFEVHTQLWMMLHQLRQLHEGEQKTVAGQIGYAHWNQVVHKPSTTFWIDAICIDQNNPEELEAQLKIMPMIYASAKATYCFLGPAIYTPKIMSDEGMIFLSMAPHVMLDQLAIFGKTLKRLCYQAFWSRLWIIQEVFYARDLWIMWGHYKVRWYCLEQVFSQVDNIRGQSQGWNNETLNKLHASPAYRIVRARREYVSSRDGKMSIKWFLEHFFASQCDPTRVFDNVLAFLSLCREDLPSEIDADWNSITQMLPERSRSYALFELKREFRNLLLEQARISSQLATKEEADRYKVLLTGILGIRNEDVSSRSTFYFLDQACPLHPELNI